ncbi:MAG TPA: DUF4831 family protein [Bacteroidales bacterium]|nr:DUF4831 family protein [Bacteroidales bacterium]HRZ48619.1 DUF4831 family protein [Bacteroidales bacterium]
MMKTNRFITAVGFLMLFSGFTSCGLLKKTPEPVVQKPFIPAFRVLSVTDSTLNQGGGGICYTLPQSRLETTITLTRIEQVKGPYAAFAGKYLGIDNVISANSVQWQIDDISVGSVPVPDTEQTFYIDLRTGDSASVPLSMMLNLNGLNSLTGSKSLPVSSQVENNFMSQARPAYSGLFMQYADENYYEIVDTVIEKITSDTQTVETKVLQKKMMEKPTEQKAKEAADLIQKLKEQRISLLTGYQEIPYDPATIRYMVSELEQMENDYLELFTGVTLTTKVKRTFVYIPNKQDDCIPVSLIRFSPAEGFISNDIQKGEPVFIQVCSQGRGVTDHTVTPQAADSARFYGFAYRIPQWCAVKIYVGQKAQKEMGMLIPQLGSVARLPWYVTNFELDPRTGAVIQFIHP